jgi:hypothetical protein
VHGTRQECSGEQTGSGHNLSDMGIPQAKARAAAWGVSMDSEHCQGAASLGSGCNLA